MRLRFSAAMILAGSLGAISAAEIADEFRLKAAFLFNFTKFVEWPAAAFKTPIEPITLCVVGKSQVAIALEQAVEGKIVRNRPLAAKMLAEPLQLSGCHVVFVPSSERKWMRDITRNALGHDVLLAGEADWFLREGGDFNLRLENGTVHIQANPDAIERQGLHVSSKLLGLAEVVR